MSLFNFKQPGNNNNALLIDNVVIKIDNLLKSLNLTPKVTPQVFINEARGFKHRYYSPCIDKDNNKIFFYALLLNHDRSRRMFLNEIRLASWIKENPLSTTFMPDYLDWSDDDDDILWLTLNQLEGNLLEQDSQRETLSFVLDDINYNDICESLFFVNSLRKRDSRLEKLFTRNISYESLVEEINNSLKNPSVKKIIDAKTTKLVAEFINSLRDKYLGDCFSHGDYHLANLFLENESSRLVVIDWESYMITWPHYDIGFFFTRLWREDDCRRKLLKRYVENIERKKIEEFSLFFRLTVVYLSTTQGLLSKMMEFSDDEMLARQQWHKKILTEALIGLDNVINL